MLGFFPPLYLFLDELVILVFFHDRWTFHWTFQTSPFPLSMSASLDEENRLSPLDEASFFYLPSFLFGNRGMGTEAPLQIKRIIDNEPFFFPLSPPT